uniref:tRNA-intron lyase n=1 Tax=Chromera velia CCMP2878 TaxID=1169474 RepID=A0A0G4EZL5_9ALVE|mmetsp:Transcript_8395/g.16296  ORF Transcript_8395/g.16296 Transcript_8395/m.16296 type:complete len:184 (-) Transcript_8395:82-633(-)|eukprot:Cvel_14449.t1-p1 / transcript=Cvel_14449.t1 / gene=Cvel_14449 / organism=Chromera_velia_CCMP2878 / gene_product=tRNA-splicing endonuclease, putative / transcript_product=tRNA-splicing endonuclease, putative / location=Cvel_scaffold1028:52578-55558(-) / protein_length=183 / sequence_SO=supercontig / SO=protein_coding / is_pseudo=false
MERLSVERQIEGDALLWDWRLALRLRESEDGSLVAQGTGTMATACQSNKNLGAPFVLPSFHRLPLNAKLPLADREEPGRSSVPTNKRQAVVRKLQSLGFSCLEGLKYGADLVVYEGDPSLVHGFFLCHCLDVSKGEKASPLQMVQWSRTAASVKKRVVLAFVEDQNSGSRIQFVQLTRDEEDN